MEEALRVVPEYFTYGAARVVAKRFGRQRVAGGRVRVVRDVVTGRQYRGRVWSARELLAELRGELAARGKTSPGRAPMARPWVCVRRLGAEPASGIGPAVYLGG